MSRQRRRRRRGPAEYPGPRKTRLPFPINMIFNVKAFYVVFIIVMIASMAAVGLNLGSASPNTDVPIIDETVAPSSTPRVQQFDGPAPVIDGTKHYTATMTTNKGDIVIDLVTDSPNAVNNLAFLAVKHFYDDTALYYINHTYIAQGGDPNCAVDSTEICTGFGSPGYTLPLETGEPHVQWSVAFPAVTQADRVHGSQFRIYFNPDARLDDKETVFGTVTEGQEILENQGDLEICTALTVTTDTCVDTLPEDAIIIQGLKVEPAE